MTPLAFHRCYSYDASSGFLLGRISPDPVSTEKTKIFNYPPNFLNFVFNSFYINSAAGCRERESKLSPRLRGSSCPEALRQLIRDF